MPTSYTGIPRFIGTSIQLTCTLGLTCVRDAHVEDVAWPSSSLVINSIWELRQQVRDLNPSL